MKEYGKAIKLAEDYFEVPYTEYREDGTAKMTGTEDFSRKRLRSLRYWTVHKNSGKKNKGNHTVWDEIGMIKTTNPKDAKKIAIIKYGNDIQLRKV